jgi:tRNA A37 methylthiotransferase MiaB
VTYEKLHKQENYELINNVESNDPTTHLVILTCNIQTGGQTQILSYFIRHKKEKTKRSVTVHNCTFYKGRTDFYFVKTKSDIY